MDISTHSISAGDCSKRGGSGELLRPANIPSSNFIRRPGIRRRETFENVAQKENSQRHGGINGAHEKEDRDSGYQTQNRKSSFQNQDVGYQKPTALHQNSTDDKENPEFESQGWTEWWGLSRGRSNLKTRETNLSQGTRADLSTTSAERELDFNKHYDNLRESKGAGTSLINRVKSFPRSFKLGTCEDISSVNHITQTLNKPHRGHSLPFKIKSDSGPTDIPEGNQSIQERIDRLFGSARGGSEWGTFPRQLSTVESKTSIQRRASFICSQKGTDSSDAESSHCFVTKSLDRARSRHTIANQIRSDRVAGGVTVITCPSKEENRLFENEENSLVNSMLGKGFDKPQEQKEAKGKTVLTTAHDQDVFQSNLKKNETEDEKKLSEGLVVPSSASVKNKIKQFEALAKKTVSQISFPRWSFSASTEANKGLDGPKKSRSVKDMAGQRELRLKEMTNGVKASAAQEKRLSWRSLSVDEGGQKIMSREVERKNLIENKNQPFEDLYQKLNQVENNGPKENSRKSRKDLPDFFKESKPEESNQRDMASHVQARKLPSTAGEDKSLTNFLNSTPLIPPLNQTVKASPTANKNKSPSVFIQAPKALDVDSPPGPLPPTTASQSSLTDPLSVHIKTPDLGRKHMQDLTAWVAGLHPGYMCWNDGGSVFDDDDQSTQRDEDSNYDSDSGGSSVTITSNMSQSDRRSFSVSLSELCNFAGPDFESEDEEDDWESVSRRSASVSSDMSVFSCVSTLATEELDKLLEDVRTVEDDNIKDFEDVQVVVLHKEVGVGLGFSLAGGVDQNKPVTVHKVFPSGVAAQEGTITEGDKVLSVNGTAFRQSTHREALDVLKKAKSRSMAVVVLQRDDVSIASKKVALEINEDVAQAQPETGQQICVHLQKNGRHLGFSLHGGFGSSEGNMPLTVKKIFYGGPIDKVFPGDEVLEIDGMSMVAMRCLEAWNFIKKLPPGSVEVVLRRPLKQT
uniref:PDZ domain-containing protein n=1 Tax=Oryzias latipes TaxID=8090 RepID=A0A3P9KM38_ORYLA